MEHSIVLALWKTELEVLRNHPSKLELVTMFSGLTQPEVEADAVAEGVLHEGAIKLDQLHWTSKRGIHKLTTVTAHLQYPYSYHGGFFNHFHSVVVQGSSLEIGRSDWQGRHKPASRTPRHEFVEHRDRLADRTCPNEPCQ